MSDNRHQEAIKRLENEEQVYSSIGRFISAFSYLEFVLKLRIQEAVELKDEFSEQIISHDFAMLCTIAQNVMCRGQGGTDPDFRTMLRIFLPDEFPELENAEAQSLADRMSGYDIALDDQRAVKERRAKARAILNASRKARGEPPLPADFKLIGPHGNETDD